MAGEIWVPEKYYTCDSVKEVVTLQGKPPMFRLVPLREPMQLKSGRRYQTQILKGDDGEYGQITEVADESGKR